jgi:hypothetical protein
LGVFYILKNSYIKEKAMKGTRVCLIELQRAGPAENRCFYAGSDITPESQAEKYSKPGRIWHPLSCRALQAQQEASIILEASRVVPRKVFNLSSLTVL